MRIILYFLKKKISKFKLSWIKKRNYVLKHVGKHYIAVKHQLKNLGYKRIKKYSLSTWKYVKENVVRFTLSAEFDKKKYLVKCGKGFDEKINNSIRFQTLFNDEFDFIPKGKELIIEGYKAYITEFINSVSFDGFCRFSNISEIDKLIQQANVILDKFDDKEVVHCDLESVNVLIQKKTNKMFLIDFDTCCSKKYGLHCASNAFPGYTIKQYFEDRIIYDDAYSFCELFKRYKKDEVIKLDSFRRLKEKIGRNIHETPLIES